jgi:hypothetical protein
MDNNDDQRDAALEQRLRAIERELAGQLVWMAGVMPVLLALLKLPATPADLQRDIVTLIEQADALSLWAMLTPDERERARDYAEHLRSMSAGGSSALRPGTK